MPEQYCLAPAWVRSQSDGDLHFIGQVQLARLYELKQGEWHLHDALRCGSDCNRKRLYPRSDGHYGRPA